MSIVAHYHPVTVQEQNTMAPVPGARCCECGTILRVNALEVAGGTEVLLSYWCPKNTCYRYGVHVHTFRLGNFPAEESQT